METLDLFIIAIGLVATFLAAFYAQRRSLDITTNERVAGRSLGPWVLGISAAAASTSGAVLAGVVGLGYSFGLVWCLMPLGYLVGDFIFWLFLAHRLHDASIKSGSISLPQMIANRLQSLRASRIVSKVIGVLIIVLMIPYITAQWMAAGKMGGFILNLDVMQITITAALIVIAYTTLSGIRGAAYTDYVQGILMLFFTLAVFSICFTSWPGVQALQETATALPDGFLSLTGRLSFLQATCMFVGFAGLAIAFNLGQPHMVNRWLSARSSATMKQARWIYLLSSQLMFLGFTALGAYIRLNLDVSDPEQALVAFIKTYAFPGAIGLLVIGTVSTIASTGSAILAVCADTLRFDVLGGQPSTKTKQLSIMIIGAGSIVALLFSDGNVFNMAITAVSLLGATLAGPVLFFITGQRFTATGLCAGLFAGLLTGIIWVVCGLSSSLNESLPGLLVSLFILYICRPRI